MEGEKKRGGRQPTGKRGKFGFRVTASLREKLEAASATTGRPVSEEIEARLERSFANDEMRSIIREELAVSPQRSAGPTWTIPMPVRSHG